jgi:hypothetical protein
MMSVKNYKRYGKNEKKTWKKLIQNKTFMRKIEKIDLREKFKEI